MGEEERATERPASVSRSRDPLQPSTPAQAAARAFTQRITAVLTLALRRWICHVPRPKAMAGGASSRDVPRAPQKLRRKRQCHDACDCACDWE